MSAQNSRAALAHPRSIAITNNGDANDLDEKLYGSLAWCAGRISLITPAARISLIRAVASERPASG